VAVAFYAGVHFPRPLTDGLRRRGVDILTAQEDHAARLSDPELLDRATQMGRAVLTFDRDFLLEAARRLEAGASFAGVIYVRAVRVSLRAYPFDLELIATACTSAEVANRIVRVPL
jgi:predicted nuclease of predicted toxin-antitoxin system